MISILYQNRIPYQGCYDCAYNGCDEKEPELRRGLCRPETRAGPRLRAGLTEVPVTGIVTRLISIRVTPMANPAMALFPNFEVVAKITKMKKEGHDGLNHQKR